jgi:F0F1-type ATP synthase membrane subunit b/b'
MNQCKTWIHPGSARQGQRCVLEQGHVGEHTYHLEAAPECPRCDEARKSAEHLRGVVDDLTRQLNAAATEAERRHTHFLQLLEEHKAAETECGRLRQDWIKLVDEVGRERAEWGELIKAAMSVVSTWPKESVSATENEVQEWLNQLRARVQVMADALAKTKEVRDLIAAAKKLGGDV